MSTCGHVAPPDKPLAWRFVSTLRSSRELHLLAAALCAVLAALAVAGTLLGAQNEASIAKAQARGDAAVVAGVLSARFNQAFQPMVAQVTGVQGAGGARVAGDLALGRT
jgi:hypothetical protein